MRAQEEAAASKLEASAIEAAAAEQRSADEMSICSLQEQLSKAKLETRLADEAYQVCNFFNSPRVQFDVALPLVQSMSYLLFCRHVLVERKLILT